MMCSNNLATVAPARLSRGHLRVSAIFLGLAALVANAQPGAPVGLSATAGDEAAVLAWQDPSDSNIARYEFRYGEAPAFNAWAAVPGSGADTVEHTVQGLANGTRYVFEVRAVDDDGAGEAASASAMLAVSPSSAVDVPDAGLRGLIVETLGLASGATLTQGDLAKLGTGWFSYSSIADLAGLEFAVNLVRLHLSNNEIEEVSALAGLTSLTTLFLSHNGISDVSPLAGLASLTSLWLTDNAISDVSPLAGLASLRRLSLSSNAISDVSPLAGLASLTTLWLTDNAISDVSALAGLASLRRLDLHDNAVSDITSLGGLESLSHLYLGRNEVADISPLLESGLGGTTTHYADLRRNPLGDGQADHVRALRESGVVVYDDGGHRVPLFPSARAGSSIVGFVRVINHSDEAGSVGIEAVDETGERRGPVSLAIDAGEALHFNAGDLEQGSPAKGLRGIGEAAGDWRLVLRSELDIEVLGYARTPDGFVTSLHDLAPEHYRDGTVRVPTFKPGSNRRQVSRLRLINPTNHRRPNVNVSGQDDDGFDSDLAGRSAYIGMPARRTLEVTAAQLESGDSSSQLRTTIGDGAGKWRLRVRPPGLRVMSLLQSPTGHLANISTGTAVSDRHPDFYSWWRGGRYRVPLFLAASSDIHGFLRIVSLSSGTTAVTLRAIDEAGGEREPAVLTLRGGRALHLNSNDLESGNAAKGLPGIGPGMGDWHLEVSGDRRFEVLAYARTADGFVTSLHDTAPRDEDGSLWIPFFNPGSNRAQASRLRLVNWGGTAADVAIAGTDDAGNSPGESVRVTVPARSARDYMAWELETGSAAGLSGALGDGAGKWRLRVSAPADVEAMSLLGLPTGHVTNLSTTPRHPPE